MTTSFDWNQFELAEPEAKGDLPMQSQTISTPQQIQTFDWSKFEEAKQPEKEKTFIEEIPRHAARTASRVAETLGGLPGDVVNLVKALGSSLPEEPAIFKRDPTFVQKGAQYLLEKLPGSQALKEYSEEKSGGYTKAQTSGEQISDEIFQDLTALMLPGKVSMPSFAKNIGTAVVAQLGKQGVKAFGGSESAQDLTRGGLLFMGGLLRPKNALDYTEALYKEAESLLPSNAIVKGTKLESSLNNLVNILEKGVETTDKRQVIKPAKELLAKIKNGNINVDELVSAKRDINKLRGDPETVKGAKKFLSSIGKYVDVAIEPYSLQNPKFMKTWREANEAFGTIAESKKVSYMIENAAKKVKYGSATAALLETVMHGPARPLIVAGAAAGGYTALKGSELLYRVMKSPTLRTHYAAVLSSAIKENGPATMQAIKRLDGILKDKD